MSHSAAQRLMARIDELAAISEEPGRLTRRFATPALSEAMALVANWMEAAGMTVRRDHLGNLTGRYEAARPDAKTLLLGSHLDTVRDAGKFDGPLGVLVALAAVEELAARGERPPFAVEVVAFADEEGLRFHSAYLGSSALAGGFRSEWLELADADGVSMAAAIRQAGGDPAAIAGERRDPAALVGWCEVHIEQGPVLERLGLPVGVVEAIAGQSRISATFSGLAGHAGTVPMELRQDALCAAAAFVLAAETLARQTAGLVATVGQLQVSPGASNVVPGSVALTLDVRHAEDEHRQAAVEFLRDAASSICSAREIDLDWRPSQESPATRCDEALTDLLALAVAEEGHPVEMLVSGAGHDAVALAPLTPVAMLFVRCKGGISHHPDESASAEDAAAAIEVLGRFLALLAERGAA
ncbi:MAG TPA: allantoate amidohydrolase [Herpetosiphonaceae bacterium]